jgi:predicted transcriptional regulator
MISQMIVRIDAEVKDRSNKLAGGEGKTANQMVRELIENYIKERDIRAYLDDLWSRIGRKLKSRGVKQKDIGRAIKGARNSRG